MAQKLFIEFTVPKFYSFFWFVTQKVDLNFLRLCLEKRFGVPMHVTVHWVLLRNSYEIQLPRQPLNVHSRLNNIDLILLRLPTLLSNRFVILIPGFQVAAALVCNQLLETNPALLKFRQFAVLLLVTAASFIHFCDSEQFWRQVARN